MQKKIVAPPVRKKPNIAEELGASSERIDQLAWWLCLGSIWAGGAVCAVLAGYWAWHHPGGAAGLTAFIVFWIAVCIWGDQK